MVSGFRAKKRWCQGLELSIEMVSGSRAEHRDGVRV
jgi:hypothetical protein